MHHVSRRAVVAGLAALPFAARAAVPGGCPAALSNLDSVADQLLKLSPETAVYNGDPSALNGGPAARRLDDYSPAGEAALRSAVRTLRTRLAATECPAEGQGRLWRDTGNAVLANAARSADIPWGHLRPLWFSAHEPYVVSQVAGPHIESANAMQAQQSVATVADAAAYVEKLASFAPAFAGVVETMRADAALGVVPPAILMAKAAAGIDAFLAPAPAANPLVATFARRMADAGLAAEVRDRMTAAATLAVRDRVYPAYRVLREQVAALAARGKTDDGVWSQPRGDELYAANVASLGDTARTPDEIHALGLAEVARISAEMDAGLRRQGYATGSVGDRMNALADEPRFRFADSDAGRAALLDYVRGLIRKAEAAYPRFLPTATIPKQTLEVRRVPVYSQDGAPGGYYDGPSLDGTRPGIYWINLRDMKSVARYRLPTLSFHEGVPGHHTQGAVALGGGEAPLLNKLASFNAYAEGWALYAERLMSELGLYADDPFGDLGRLQDELFRAVRLVVDTGLHHKRWSREKAIAYFRETTGVAATRVTAEVERYMAWPAQALGYKLGQLRILELRAAAQATLGSRFDIRGFHDALLRAGPAPLAVASAAVDRWTAAAAHA